jgi:hypothetical protein
MDQTLPLGELLKMSAYLGSPVFLVAGVLQAVYLRRCLGARGPWSRIIGTVAATLTLAWLATLVLWLSLSAAFRTWDPLVMIFGFILVPALIAVVILVPGMSFWLCRRASRAG